MINILKILRFSGFSVTRLEEVGILSGGYFCSPPSSPSFWYTFYCSAGTLSMYTQTVSLRCNDINKVSKKILNLAVDSNKRPA